MSRRPTWGYKLARYGEFRDIRYIARGRDTYKQRDNKIYPWDGLNAKIDEVALERNPWWEDCGK